LKKLKGLNLPAEGWVGLRPVEVARRVEEVEGVKPASRRLGRPAAC